MFRWWTNLSVQYKLGSSIVLFALLLIITLGFYVQDVQAQAGNAREINNAGFLRATLVRMNLLANEIANAERNGDTTLLELERTIQDYSHPAQSLAALYTASDEVTPEEFQSYLLNLRQDYPHIQWISYIEVLTPTERTDLEAEGDLLIFELDGDNIPQTAAPRDLYYPNLLLEPRNAYGNLIGLDMASLPRHLDTLRSASEQARPMALPTTINGEASFLIFSPIYQQGSIPNTLDERRANLQGFIATSLDLVALVNAINDRFTEQVLGIRDVTAGTGTTLISTTNPFDLFLVERSLSIFEREWRLELTQTTDVSSSQVELDTLDQFFVAQLQNIEDGNPEVGLEGLSRHTSPAIQESFDAIRPRYADFQFSLSRFERATTPDERFNALNQLNRNQEVTFSTVDIFVNTLEEELEQEAVQSSQQALTLGVIALVVAILPILSVVGVIRNLNTVNATAQQIAQGDLSARSHITTGDEVGQISANLNDLAERLQSILTSLETQVTDQTRDLETVLDVSGRIATILQLDRLLQDVVDLIKERFSLYHAHIYLLDEKTQRLVLTAGAGYVGRQMVSEQRTIPMTNLRSIVADTARNRRSVTVNDVQSSPTFLPHPLLPDTLSEFATALVSRGQVLGVLDVQSNQRHFFDANLQKLLETTASQVATAISNARLFEETDRVRRHQEALGHLTEQMQTALDIDEFLKIVARELGKALRVPNTAIELGNSNSHPIRMSSED